MLFLKGKGWLRRLAEFGPYARYGTQAALAASLEVGAVSAAASAVIVASGIGAWLTLGFLFFPGYFIQEGVSGFLIAGFFALVAASCGLLRASKYFLAPKRPGHFLNPIPPFRAASLPEEKVLVRAASGDDAALLRPVHAPAPETAPRQLLRAVNSESME